MFLGEEFKLGFIGENEENAKGAFCKKPLWTPQKPLTK